jgi:hypothetical protein
MACSPPRGSVEWRRNGAIRTPNLWFDCNVICNSSRAVSIRGEFAPSGVYPASLIDG